VKDFREALVAKRYFEKKAVSQPSGSCCILLAEDDADDVFLMAPSVAEERGCHNTPCLMFQMGTSR